MALFQGLLTRNKRKLMQLLWILRQNFRMIKSSWTYFGTTLVVQLSILAVGLVDTLHGFLKMGLATSVCVIDNSQLMIDECMKRGLPGLSVQVADIETADLGREKYDMALARFVLMHVRELEGTLNHIAMSLKDKGTLTVVTNIIEGAPTALTTFIEETSRIMKLFLQPKGQPILVSNYVRTQADYTKALQQAGLRIESSKKYEPQILRLEKEYPGIMLSHLVLVGKK
jgi:hypothetical protein